MSTASIAGILVMLPALVGIAILWRWSGPGLTEPKPLPQPRELLAKAKQALDKLAPPRRPQPAPTVRIGAHRSRVPRYAPLPTMHSVAEIRAREDADHLAYYPRLRRG
ncbi:MULTISPECIES: hypothetical protein [unclassified Crossiella]|uniref:hypothetical protein n=1 Tax=unclassified Crossiella TaxID=2620835 RepID=UPI001FFF21DC|nr:MULTISPECIES: hypothetical protein [unclassified Crossiella]MCK2239575.1 hypothetical protein [Crossiella sp. S99.2]MCK2252270.1 hypothetical protein [Crossiella sp. S99.1]